MNPKRLFFIETALKGVFLIDVFKITDERGFFCRCWCQREFEDQGLNFKIVQSNVSYNYKKGTIRGLHYQAHPHEEDKLIRCISGSMYDVILDLRPTSPTFGGWVGVELSGKNMRMVFVPKGCAHGYETLEDNTEVFYHVSSEYCPEYERGIRWNDPMFRIKWPIDPPVYISEKDTNYKDYLR